MAVGEHVYDIPSEEELARLVGSATPHFSQQIRARVASFAAVLPPDHARQPELAAHLAHLDALAAGGENAGLAGLDLPAKLSLTDPSRP